jgi:hypothetical protein
MTERDDLLAVVTAARDALHPEIDDQFLADVLDAERANPDQENAEQAAAALRAVEAAADRALGRSAR